MAGIVMHEDVATKNAYCFCNNLIHRIQIDRYIQLQSRGLSGSVIADYHRHIWVNYYYSKQHHSSLFVGFLKITPFRSYTKGI